MGFGEPSGQGWLQIGELGVALFLSALIGFEREIRQKSAGLRTHSLVGLASALIVLVSKYGFTDILAGGRIVLDPSRIAAQIVSGIGFIGGGLIFVRRDAVRGLTTAASIWLTAAVGMASGAGLPLLAVVVTAGHFLIVFVFPFIARAVPKSRWAPSALELTYEEGRGILRKVLVACTGSGFTVSRVGVERRKVGSDGKEANSVQVDDAPQSAPAMATVPHPDGRTVTVFLELQGTAAVSDLVAKLAEIDGVVAVHAGDVNEISE